MTQKQTPRIFIRNKEHIRASNEIPQGHVIAEAFDDVSLAYGQLKTQIDAIAAKPSVAGPAGPAGAAGKAIFVSSSSGGGGGGGTVTPLQGQEFTGDGATQDWTLSATPTALCLCFYNGQLLKFSRYTVTGTALHTDFIPAIGELITAVWT